MYNKIGKVAAQKLTTEAVQSTLSKGLKGWTIADNAIHREYTLGNFEQTWAFLNQVAMRSHLWGHHPTITTVSIDERRPSRHRCQED
ncbi:CYFA0S01e06766g1_1 [Cyberlindnera fabianii]|uniref:4a-hydroxytetrahydrobiopterin dehydratase n=1 Tax=Cyberlindnera fabianii TaxID=36022 RepID=A0A061AHM8_CYBFA|nr:CYFA0S01e06766g1_1 [Cyberlindnera fabianii]